MSDTKNGAPVPPEGMDQAARQEAADAAYGRAHSADTTAASMNAGKAREAEAQAKKARKDAEAAEKAAMKAERKKEKDAKKAERAAQGKGSCGFGKACAGGATGALAVVVVAALVTGLTPLGSMITGSSSSNSNGTITIENSDDATLAEAVSAKCLNSVVTLYVYSANSSWSQYFNSGSSSSDSPSALGSGVVIQSDSDKSYILTNYHVLQGCSKATITIDNKTYTCSAVGYDSSVDLAVVSIPVGNLTVMEWGDSDSINVGEWCMAIGSPLGYENTCTTGIVSAVGRNGAVQDGSNTYYNSNVIQTDASINPGNSGGALVDDEGKLIGIVEYLASNSESSAGLGFAIPQSTAQSIAEKIISSGGEVSSAFLGVVTNSSDSSTGTASDGIEVTAVVKGSAAAKAGIKAGDVLTKVDDATIGSYADLKSAISPKTPGDKVTLTWTHNGNEKTATVELTDDSIADNGYSSQLDDSSSNSGNSGNGGQSQDDSNGWFNSGDSDQGYGLEDFLEQFYGQSGNGSSGSDGSDSDSGSFWD